jgi:hypothetical protein
MGSLSSSIRVCGWEVRSRTFLAVAVLFLLLYYAVLLSNGTFWLLRPVQWGLTFNSMAANLFEGRFDVDPLAIGAEGFVHGGRTYAYFGIFLAVLRAPLVVFRGLLTTDVTALSCLVATCVMSFLKLATLSEIYHSGQTGSPSTRLFWPMALTLALGGAQIQFLKPSIYQEVCSWGGAIAAAFVYCCVRGLVARREFTNWLLALMAGLVGLAFLTRVSIGVGLGAAYGLLLLILSYQGLTRAGWSIDAVGAQVRRFVWPLTILLVLVLGTGLVNYQRWGNPLTFVDLSQHLMNARYPDRLVRLERYGAFNIARLWFGTLYYFVPIWIFTRSDGHFLFYERQHELIDTAELPPSTFVLSDPLLLGLCGVLFLRCARRQRRVVDSSQSLALLLGLSTAPFLILMASYMAFRYRIEFYPVLELGAFVGLSVEGGAAAPVTSRFVRAAWVAATLGIIASHGLLILYKISPAGGALEFIGPAGVLAFYRDLVLARIAG